MRLPKPGDVVSIEWLDSGKDFTGTAGEVRKTNLSICTLYGRVQLVDDQRVVVAFEHDTDSDDKWGIVWIPSIRKITWYQALRSRKGPAG